MNITLKEKSKKTFLDEIANELFVKNAKITKYCRKAPFFRYGDIRQSFL